MNRHVRIGILGGTFDPIHVGHLHIATCALKELELDEVLLMPAGSPPHKPHDPVSPAQARMEMVKLAVRGCQGLSAADLDLSAMTPSFTSDLLIEVARIYQGADLRFIIGSDSLADFPAWHAPHDILRQARLAVAERPGWPINEVLESSPMCALGESVDRFNSIPVNLSASTIRDRLRSGQPVDWLVMPEVLHYIRQSGLYRDNVPE